MARLNPFVPNSPVNPGMFVGRLDEVERLEACLLHARAGMPSHFMITGERGIGKSSLLLVVKDEAEGLLKVGNERLHFLVVDADVDRSTTQLGLVKRIELGIRRKLEKSEPAKAFLDKAWQFVQRFEAAGMKLREGQKESSVEVLLDEFAYSLAETAERLASLDSDDTLSGAPWDGILILIDEADNASPQMQLGAYLKLLTERLQRRGCSRVVFGLAGLPDLRMKLAESHLSAPRVFQEVVLDRLSPREVNSVLDICLTRAKVKNSVDVTITKDARTLLRTLSEGYPHFIQQYGYSAFAADKDNEIDVKDVSTSAFGPSGALKVIGDNYYRDDFYGKIKEESYRQVLRIMADELDEWVSKKAIAAKFKGRASSLANAIKALRDRRIIFAKEGTKGTYRLQPKGFALWIKLHAAPVEQLQFTGLDRAALLAEEPPESV